MPCCGRYLSITLRTTNIYHRLRTVNVSFFSSFSNSPIDGDTLIEIASQSRKYDSPMSVKPNFLPITASQKAHQSQMMMTPNEPKHPKVLRVSVLGMPNAGKSTFINAILGKTVMATSDKIDTTTENTDAVSTVGDTQVIFQDTPGIIASTKAKRLGIHGRRPYLPSESFKNADIAIILTDLTSIRVKNGFLQPEILLTMLKNKHVPTVLVLNKIDKYKKKLHLPILIHQLTAGVVAGVSYEPKKIEIAPMRAPKVTEKLLQNVDELDLTNVEDLDKRLMKSETSLLNKLRNYRGWPHFQDVFVISARDRLGLDVLRNYMLFHAKPGSWIYHDDIVTDANPKQIILDAIRGGLLSSLPKEIPYKVKPVISELEELDDGRLYICIDVICNRQSHFNCIRRTRGRISRETQEHLQDVFFLEVFVQINPIFVKNFKI